MIYANNAGTSWPKPSEVRAAAAEALQAPPAGFEAARAEVAEFLGVADSDRLLFTPSCTSALAVAIGDLPWSEGDVVVTSSLEHHAVAGPVARLVRDRGVVHRAAPRTSREPVDLDFARDVLAGGRVRLVAATAASNVTGEVLPVAELAALAHEFGAWFLMDAAQTAGVLPVDVASIDADIAAIAGHKGPLAPQGVGVLWSRPEVAFESPDASCEIGGDACRSTPGYCDVGGGNAAGIAGLAAGVRWLSDNRPGDPGVVQRGLAARLVAALRGRPRSRVYGGDAFGRTAAVSIAIDGLAPERAEAFFAERGVAVRAGQHCAPQALAAIGAPEGTIRISFGPFNSEEDLETILGAIDEAAGTAPARLR